MAIHKRHMMSILMRNGHLELEGDETTEELRTALLYLRAHTIVNCHVPELGVPIEALIPDASVLMLKSTRSRNVSNVGTRGERL